jgi:hypothetical protein
MIMQGMPTVLMGGGTATRHGDEKIRPSAMNPRQGGLTGSRAAMMVKRNRTDNSNTREMSLVLARV